MIQKALSRVQIRIARLKDQAHCSFVSQDAITLKDYPKPFRKSLSRRAFIHEFADIFSPRWTQRADWMYRTLGKSYNNLIESIFIGQSSDSFALKFVYSLGILGSGCRNARLICGSICPDFEAIEMQRQNNCRKSRNWTGYCGGVVDFFKQQKNQEMVTIFFPKLLLVAEQTDEQPSPVTRKTFVITGSLKHFENRSALKALIEEKRRA